MSSETVQSTSLADAKARFAAWVRRAERGESIVLTRHGRPVARLVPLASGGVRDGAPDRELQAMGSEVREREAGYETHSGAPPSDRRVRRTALQRLLEDEVWPQIPEQMIGKAPTRKEREEILGIHEEGA